LLGQATCQTNRVDFFVLYTIVSLDVLEILSEFEEHLVKISRKTLGSLILPLTLSLLLFAPPTIQPCQEAEASQSNCCCCQNSCQHVVSSDSKHSQCPCQMEEKQKEEQYEPAVTSPAQAPLRSRLFKAIIWGLFSYNYIMNMAFT